VDTYMVHHIAHMITSGGTPALRQEEAKYRTGGPLRMVSDQLGVLWHNLEQAVTAGANGTAFCNVHPAECLG
jgi:hypothetical protein